MLFSKLYIRARVNAREYLIVFFDLGACCKLLYVVSIFPLVSCLYFLLSGLCFMINVEKNYVYDLCAPQLFAPRRSRQRNGINPIAHFLYTNVVIKQQKTMLFFNFGIICGIKLFDSKFKKKMNSRRWLFS